MTLLRGYGEGLPLHRWLEERVYPFEDRITDEDVYWATLLGVAEMLASGVTRFYDMYSHCLSICDAVELAGIRANISRGLVSFDGSPLKGSLREREALEIFDRKSALITPEISVHAEYTSHESYVREAANLAESLNANVHIHLSETEREHSECLARHGVTPTRYFERCGLFNRPTTAAHCVHVTADDMQILREYGVTAAHCPESNLKLDSGIAPAKALLAAGVTLAIGTDGASSNNNLNMLEELHTAALLGHLTPSEVLSAAFRGNKIAPGAVADLAVIDLNKPHLTPNFDLVSSLVFAAQASDVSMTVVAGNVVYRDGQVRNFDVAEALSRSAAAAARISRELL
jgi:5-methylthioadenosine/S-adenosylhomocysteine deaminase